MYPVQRGKISIFASFGDHLGFSEKMKKIVNISETERDRAVLSELLIHRVVQ